MTDEQIQRLLEIQTEVKRSIEQIATEVNGATWWEIENHIVAIHVLAKNANWAIYQTLETLIVQSKDQPDD